MRKRQWLFYGGVSLALVAALGTTRVCAAQQAKPELPPELSITPSINPMPELEVVSVRKSDDKPVVGQLVTTLRSYLRNAYGISQLQESRLIGGPSWLDSQHWVINGKPSDELRDAMTKMSPEQQAVEGQMLRRSVLMDRFKLKTHIETRQMAYLELVPAKGGLKIKEVPATVPPGMIRTQLVDGKNVSNAHATTIHLLINLILAAQEVGGRLIVDKTGFRGSFDMLDVQWAGSRSRDADAAPVDTDAPSIFTALEEKLGLKLVQVKGPVEVVVIDSIEQPTEN